MTGRKERADESLQILLHANQLKRTARSGWIQRGVPNAENVAAHSYGVAFITLILVQLIQERLDLGRILAMAVLHDLPEGLTTDIPTPTWRLMPPGIKSEIERTAMNKILDSADFHPDLLALWEELEAEQTAEARLVHDADRLDMYLQALVYEQQSGNRRLHEFWVTPAVLHFPQAQELYNELRSQWEAMQG